MWVGGQRQDPAAPSPRERGTVPHCTAGCVGPSAGLWRVQKILSPLGLDPRIVQTAASWNPK